MVSPFPFDAIPVVPRGDLGLINALARWLAIAPRGGLSYPRLEKLAGGRVMFGRIATGGIEDPYAGVCAARLAGELVEIRGSHRAVRHLAQRVLGGPQELAAPRPPGMVEHAMWALAVAAIAEDLGVDCEVVACEAPPTIPNGLNLTITLDFAGVSAAVGLRAPQALELAVPQAPMRRWPESVMIDAPVVVGRCALAVSELAVLAVRSLITLEPPLGEEVPLASGRIAAELAVLGGIVGISGKPEALVAEVTTGYVPRAMALPDDAHVELTVGLGTTRLSLRQVFELAIGQVVPLGRPLAGPFEIHAAGKRVGSGELVSIDGELGVRIVSLEE